MAEPGWQISGDYFETRSCDFLCPCLPSNFAARPSHGACTRSHVHAFGMDWVDTSGGNNGHFAPFSWRG